MIFFDEDDVLPGLCNVHERLTVLNGFSWDIVPSGTTLMFEYGERLSSRHHKCNNKINPWGRGTIVLKTSFKWTTWMHTDREQLSVDENNDSAICFAWVLSNVYLWDIILSEIMLMPAVRQWIWGNKGLFPSPLFCKRHRILFEELNNYTCDHIINIRW